LKKADAASPPHPLVNPPLAKLADSGLLNGIADLRYFLRALNRLADFLDRLGAFLDGRRGGGERLRYLADRLGQLVESAAALARLLDLLGGIVGRLADLLKCLFSLVGAGGFDFYGLDDLVGHGDAPELSM
jgi:hypothetical protein